VRRIERQSVLKDKEKKEREREGKPIVEKMSSE
jgi:hypothetical protein